MPSVAEQASINQMVSKVKQILDNVMNTPKKIPNVEIQEIREVGSFKKGTMMTKSNIADLVVILKTLPTVELVMALGQKVVDDLKSEQKESEFISILWKNLRNICFSFWMRFSTIWL